jgi:hypothetical protein
LLCFCVALHAQNTQSTPPNQTTQDVERAGEVNAPATSATPLPERPTTTPPGEIANPSTANVSPVADPALENNSVVYPFKTGSLPAEKTNPVRIARFDAAPVIDGNLDDTVWRSAAVLRDFYQTTPGDNSRPSKRTRVLLGYDAKNLYIAFEAEDEPDKVRATIAKRDSVFGDDNVRIILDTFNDQRRAYVLGFNPLGIQADGIMTEGRNTDFSVDILMESKGVITKDGYIVEVRVPFKSLRYERARERCGACKFSATLTASTTRWILGCRSRATARASSTRRDASPDSKA